MGIGRRAFLKQFGTFIATVAATPSSAVGLFDDVYLNRRLGVGFQKPAGWRFVNAREMGMMKEGQLLDVDDIEYNETVLGSMDLPFVAIEKDPSSREAVGVGAQFYLASDPSEQENDIYFKILRMIFGKRSNAAFKPRIRETKAMKKIRYDWQASRGLLKSFRVSSMPRDFELSGCVAAEYTASYLFEHTELSEPRLVRSRAIFVEHHRLMYLIRLVDSEDNPFDFDPFVAGLKLI